MNNDIDDQKDVDEGGSPFVGDLFLKDQEESLTDTPLLDMPGEEGALTDEEREGLAQSPVVKTEKKRAEPPVLSPDFLGIDLERPT